MMSMTSIGTGGWGWGWSGQDGAGLGSSYSGKVLGYSPIAYWPLNEATGTNANCLVNSAQDGTYTGVTLGQTGIGDGNTCPLFDGTNDYLDVYTTAFRDAFDGNEGSIMFWLKANTVVIWTNATDYFCYRFRADADNYLQIYQGATNFYWGRVGNGNTDSRTIDSSAWDTDWINIAFTWSKTADDCFAYKDGVKQGATIDYGEDLVGNLAEVSTNIGTNTQTPHNPWHGWLAHFVVWDSALTPTQIADLAVV